MPEGHTIHRLARQHRRMLRGQRVRASSPQGRFEDGARLIDGQVLETTDAYGKHLFHRYADDLWLHVHLGLYGKFTHGPLPAPEPRGALRLRLEADEQWLDLRGAITCELVSPPERAAILARLGPDPLRLRATPDAAAARLARSRAPIGVLLMDQAVIAGIGNVYRAEILFRHRVSPWTPGRDLVDGVWTAMWEDLSVLMRAGVRSGRIVTTEPADRARTTGRAGRHDTVYVYRRTGQPCRRCGTPIRTTVMATRNLFWCPSCQPDP